MDVTNTLAPTASVDTKKDTGKPSISADFETFLKMLTAQMKNQDPLNPLNSQDFATQLATFSGVEQQVRTNDLLTSLQSQFTSSNLGEMSGWVGMEARMAVPAQFDGTPIEIVPNPPVFADRTELVVWDGNGVERQRLSIPVGDDPYQWAGVSGSGQPFEDGEYSFGIVAYANDEVIDESVPETFVNVKEVRSIDGEALVMVEGGALYPATLVRGLR
ncbi:MAG: flagellar hook capping FlgD N-terminal domain-containing protein [Pseudomonadota bacterium]